MAEADLLDSYLLSEDNTKIYLIGPMFTIGRNPENSHQIEDRRISKVHCEFERINDVWYITNKSSSVLTKNNHIMASQQQHILSNGDVIKLPNRCNYVFVNENKSTVISNASKSPLESNLSTGNLRSRNANISKRRHSMTSNMNVLSEDTSGTSTQNTDEEPSLRKRKIQNKNETFEQIDDNLKCVICTEISIEASKLNCLHTFCKFCIEAWQRKDPTCPMCRAGIIKIVPATELDESIAKFLDSASSEAKQERAKVIEDRQKQKMMNLVDDVNSFCLTAELARPFSINSIPYYQYVQESLDPFYMGISHSSSLDLQSSSDSENEYFDDIPLWGNFLR